MTAKISRVMRGLRCCSGPEAEDQYRQSGVAGDEDLVGERESVLFVSREDGGDQRTQRQATNVTVVHLRLPSMSAGNKLGSCRLELAFSFVRTEPRRARESLVGPLAPALDHRIGGLVRHRPGGVPTSAARRAAIPG